jgi:hypothetical protein
MSHQERAQVRVAEPKLAERARVDADLLSRIARRADDDLLREQDDVDGVLEARDVEAPVLAAELHQVERREVAGRIVDVHIFTAGIGSVDPPADGVGVPAVDRRVVLNARIGAAPGCLGYFAHQLARAQRLADRLARRARRQAPFAVLLDGAHELVGHTH